MQHQQRMVGWRKTERCSHVGFWDCVLGVICMYGENMDDIKYYFGM